MIEDKLRQARTVIQAACQHSTAPAVLASFGKDSALLLALVRGLCPAVAVIHLQPLSHATKHAFAETQMQKLQVKCSVLPLVSIDAVARGAEINLVEEYAVSPGFSLYLPFENEPGRPVDEKSACGVEVLNAKTRQLQPAQSRLHDVVFIGHRADDGDLIFGAMPVAEYQHQAADVLMVYPLRDFTESDVWEASALLGVEQNTARYAGEMAANNDYYPLCTECFKGDAKRDTLTCPKTQQTVFNLGNLLDLESRRKDWRARFVNLKETA